MRYVTNYVGQLFRALTAPFRFLLNLPTIFVSAPQRLMGLTLPTRVAVIVAICLVVVLLVHLTTLALVQRTMQPSVWLREYGPVALLLTVAIPLVTYFTLKLWLQGDTSRFPDIDAAWKAGVSALEEQGLDPRSIPIFVVLGPSHPQQVQSLLAASGLEFAVEGVPHGRAPLEWYANERCVFLVVNGAGLLSKTNSLAAGQGVAGYEQPASSPPIPQGVRGTLMAGGAGGDPSRPVASSRDTLSRAADSGWDEGDAVRGTMVPSVQQTLAPGAGTPRSGQGGGQLAARGAVGLSRQDADQQTDRLRHVCRLLVRARQPLCPINGILTLLSAQVIGNIMAAKEVQDAVSTDLSTAHDVLELRAPVVALVVDMEQKSGFFELVRRVGAGSRSRRFGKGFQVWNRPGEDQLAALSIHACGAFEDWVYHLFQEPGGMNKPGNRKLYTLLGEIRLRLQARVRNILVNAYSCAPSGDAGSTQSWLFGGCYFAATGETEDRQAFVRDVFRRMIDLQDEVEWSDRALRANQRYQQLAQAGMFIDGLLALGLITLLVGRYLGRW